MAQRSTTNFRPFVPSGRVFILGAGASRFVGFPVGCELYDFIIDHAEPTISVKWLAHYVESLPAEDRAYAIKDLEKLLTRVENGEIQSYEDAKPVQLKNPEAWGQLIPAMRHACANRKPSDMSLRTFVEGELKSLTTGVSGYSLEDFIDAIRRAFLAHHACVLHGGWHFDCSDPLETNDIPSQFTEQLKTRGRCPCARRYSWRRQSHRLEALARNFRRGDCIVTFNWDVLVESVLWSAKKWSPVDGYGLFVQFESPGTVYRRVKGPSPIKILKAHGSINWVNFTLDNWDFRHLGLRYLGLLFNLPIYSSYSPPVPSPDPDEIFGPDPLDWQHTILRPTYQKNYTSDPLLSEVWKQISEAIETADEITVIGYSLPPGDDSAREQLRSALSRNSRCRHVKFVNDARVIDTNWRPLLDSVDKTPKHKFRTMEDWLGAS